MKTLLLLILLTLLLAASPTQPQAREVIYEGNTYHVYYVDTKQQQICMYWKDGKGDKLHSLSRLKTEVESKGEKLLMATNGGMYTPDHDPQGLYIEDSKQLNPIDQRQGKGNFYMQPNGVFMVTPNGAGIVASSEYTQYEKLAVYATQSGPLLVRDGVLNNHFTKGSSNVNIRSGVGIDDKGQVVFVISKGAVNFYDFAMLFKDILHCKNALYLDGAISRMYLPVIGRKDLDGDFGVMIAVVQASRPSSPLRTGSGPK